MKCHVACAMSLQNDLTSQESSDKSVIELQQYAKKNKPNLHILNKLQEEMIKLAAQRVGMVLNGILVLKKKKGGVMFSFFFFFF